MPFGITQEFGHALTIKDEGLTLTANAASLDFTGAGVSGTVLGNAVTETIAGGGTSFTPVKNEIPSDPINGSNTVFNLAHTPLYGVIVVLNSGTLTPTTGGTIGDYALSGSVVTFVIPPPTGSIITFSYEF